MNATLAARHDFAIELAREAGILAATLRRSLGVLSRNVRWTMPPKPIMPLKH